MLGSLLLLMATALRARVLAAPLNPSVNVAAAGPDSMDSLSSYFDMLASKVQQSRSMAAPPVCDMAKAVVDRGDVDGGLPPPAAGLTLKHVAIGRGIQKYTCDPRDPHAAPVACGAVATLFNASCVAATNPDLLALLPRVAVHFNLTPAAAAANDPVPRLPPTDLVVSGHHYFTAPTTPFFDLDVPGPPALQLGTVACTKMNAVPAPRDAPRGQLGEHAVAWLNLLARPGATGRLHQVYRVHTAGGSAPPTCAGMPSAFDVQYSAQYWFYQT